VCVSVCVCEIESGRFQFWGGHNSKRINDVCTEPEKPCLDFWHKWLVRSLFAASQQPRAPCLISHNLLTYKFQKFDSPTKPSTQHLN